MKGIAIAYGAVSASNALCSQTGFPKKYRIYGRRGREGWHCFTWGKNTALIGMDGSQPAPKWSRLAFPVSQVE